MNTTTACPEVGVWRAWLDQELEDPRDADMLAAHLDGCPGCRETVAELRDDATTAHIALSTLAGSQLPSHADAAVARQRLEWRRNGAPRTRSSQPSRRATSIASRFAAIPSAWRVAASGLAAALIFSFLVAFTPEGRAAAAGFLAQFRSQQVAAIEITPQSQAEIIRTFETLNNLGTVQGTTPSQARANEQKTVSMEDAAKTVGFALSTPDPATLPAGVDKTPRITVMPAFQERFTFNKAKAASYFKANGHPEVSLPDKFDGATLVVSVPSAALMQYGSSASRDALIVGQAGELEVDVQGNVGLAELRDFLLGLPGLPASTVAQLRQIQNWNETLPIPVPVDRVNWQQASFPNGGQGLLLNDNSGVGSAAIWQARGHLYGVAGSLKASDLKRVADSLATR